MTTSTPYICLVPWQDELLVRTMDIDFHGTRTGNNYIDLSSELPNLVPPPPPSSSSSSIPSNASSPKVRYIAPLTDPDSQIMDIILMRVLSSSSSSTSPLRTIFTYLQRLETYDYGKNLPYTMEQMINKAKVPGTEVQQAFKKMMVDLARYAVLAITDYSMFGYEYPSSSSSPSVTSPVLPTTPNNNNNSPIIETSLRSSSLNRTGSGPDDTLLMNVVGKVPWSATCSPSHYELFTSLLFRTIPNNFIPTILQQFTSPSVPAFQTMEIQQIFLPLFSELVTRLTMVNIPSDTPQADIDEINENTGNSPFRTFLHENVMAAESTTNTSVYAVEDTVQTKFRGGLRTTSVPSVIPKPSNLSSRLSSFPGPTLLRQETFVPYLTILDQLLAHNDLLHVLLNDNESTPLWGWSILQLPNPFSADSAVATPKRVIGSSSSSPSIPSPPPTGKAIEQRTCLGRILSLGPQVYDFITIDGQDLLDAYIDIKQLSDDTLPEVSSPENASFDTPMTTGKLYGLECTAGIRSKLSRGIQRLLPVVPVNSQELFTFHQSYHSAVKQTHTLLREGIVLHRRLTSSIITRLAKVKYGREALFGWMGKLLDSNSLRSSLAFTACRPNSNTVNVASGTLLYNSLHTMINLCLPFLDPVDPKHARIDPRYMTSNLLVPNGNGGGRFRTDKEERVAPFVDYEDTDGTNENCNEEGNNGAQTASWLDARNLARQQQFKQQQAALIKRAKLEANVNVSSSNIGTAQTPPKYGGSVSSTPPLSRSSSTEVTTGTPGNRKYTEPLSWHNITEIFWLTIRLANIGYLSSCSRQENLYSSIERAREEYSASYDILHQAGINRTDIGTYGRMDSMISNTYGQWLYARNRSLRSLIIAKFITETWLFDTNAASVDPMMQLYRSLAVHLLRIVNPSQAKYVPGMTDDNEYIFQGTGGVVTTSGSSTNATNNKTTILSTVNRTLSPSLSSTSSSVLPPAIPTSSSPSPIVPSVSSVTFLPLPEPRLPLPPPIALYCGLPAFLVHDIGEFFIFLQRSPLRRNLFESTYFSPPVARDILKFILTYLASPLYVANPYDRGKLVQALSVFVPGRYDRWRDATLDQSKPLLHTLIGTDSLAVQYTLPALITFHVDIGISGSHTGFYDKFNYRHTSSDILIYLWQLSPGHRDTLVKFANSSETGPNSFLRFASELINDSDYHLGEALKALEEIRTMEKKIDDHHNRTVTLSSEEIQDTEKHLRTQENMARGSLRYATEQILLLSLLTTGITHVWLTRNLRDRIAACLGYYMDQLCGSKRTNLRIKNMDKVGFKPREVLLQLITIYNNLAIAGPRAGAEKDEGGTMWLSTPEKDNAESSFERSLSRTTSTGSTSNRAPENNGGGPSSATGDTDILAFAIIRDERSFHIENFTNAQQILADPRFILENPSASTQVQRLETLIKRLLTAYASKQAFETDLGDLPDEITDPLLSDLMDDPVLLPTSRVVVQRDSIEHSLLNEERDPYNRSYLTKSMLIELPLLKESIHNWMQARKQKQEPTAEIYLKEIIRLLEEEPRQVLGLPATNKETTIETLPSTVSSLSSSSSASASATTVVAKHDTGGNKTVNTPSNGDAMDTTVVPLNSTDLHSTPPSVTLTTTTTSTTTGTIANVTAMENAFTFPEDDDDLAAALALSLAEEETLMISNAISNSTNTNNGNNVPVTTTIGIPSSANTDTDDDLAMAIWVSLTPEEQALALSSNTTGFQPPNSSNK